MGREVGAPADRLKVRTRGPRVIINSRHCARQTVYPCDPDSSLFFFPSRGTHSASSSSPFRLRVAPLNNDLRVRFTEPSMPLFLIAETVDLDYTRGEERREAGRRTRAKDLSRILPSSSVIWAAMTSKICRIVSTLTRVNGR